MNNFSEAITELNVKNTASVSIIQITDTHIMEEGTTSFNDYDTSASLNKVVEKIKNNEQDADLILLTGDLVHEPTQVAYQKLADSLIGLTTPLHCLPGNHDDPDMMEYVMGANGFDSNKIIKAGNWSIILLNSFIPGDHGGCLSEAEFSFLENSLDEHKAFNCLVALHHHPVSIASTWMDGMMLTNGDDFFNIIDEHEQVKAIIWGHIHQEFETIRNNVRLLGTPSTCLQFTPKSDAFGVDDKTPAYRKISLDENGEISTNVVYV